MNRLYLKLLASLTVMILIVVYTWLSGVDWNEELAFWFYLVLYLAIFSSLFIIDYLSSLFDPLPIPSIVKYIVYLIVGGITIPIIYYVMLLILGIFV